MCVYSAHMARTLATTPFAGWLRTELDARNWGVRTLARKIDPHDPEPARRALNRYLYEGARPTNGYRLAIAAAFGLSEDELPVDDEEPG